MVSLRRPELSLGAQMVVISALFRLLSIYVNVIKVCSKELVPSQFAIFKSFVYEQFFFNSSKLVYAI